MAHSVKSYSHAREVTRREAKNFYYAFRLLDPARRNAIYAVYAFSRRADDAVDSVQEKNASEEEARSKLDGLSRLLRGETPEDPLSPALLDTIERFKIPVEHFSELLLGMEMDLEKKRYETFDELYTYCFRAASAVGLICIEIFGYSEDAEAAHQHAEELGIAMQLTNILRDVREDMTLGRIYLPGEDLARFNYSEAELSRYEFTPAFRDLMEFQVERARDYFQRSEALFPLIDTQTRYCPVLLKRLYSKILDRIESQGYDVFSRRPALSRLQKLCMLMAAARDARKARRAASKK
tara:strand:+ start:4167 stop:5051 length:885 start_codon:yes stop_codon:yes gene_type:complete